jgi:hypothetical protein
MTPKVALGIDAVCWVLATLAMWKWGSHSLAIVLGVFSVIYLYRCIKVMLQITKAEQMFQDTFDDFEDPRDYH